MPPLFDFYDSIGTFVLPVQGDFAEFIGNYRETIFYCVCCVRVCVLVLEELV